MGKNKKGRGVKMQNQNVILFILLAIFAGTVVTLQGPINVELGKSLNNAYWATFASFFIGTFVVLAFLVISKQSLPSGELIRNTSLWKYLGAVTGAIYVLSVITIIPILGVGFSTILLMFSQLVTAMVIDHFGLFGYPVRPFDMVRLSGVFLMALGIYLINKK